MPQIMKPKILDLRLLERLIPGIANVHRLPPVAARKHQRRPQPPYLAVRSHHLQGLPRHRYASRLAVLGVVERHERPLHIQLRPGQAEQLHLTSTGGKGEHHHRVEHAVAARLARRQKPGPLVVV